MLIRAKLLAEARPVRRPPSSSCSTETAFSIFSSASKSVSSITSISLLKSRHLLGRPVPAWSARRSHPGTDLLTADHLFDVAVGKIENHDRHPVVPAEADRGRVGHLQPTLQHLVVADFIELDRVRVQLGV